MSNYWPTLLGCPSVPRHWVFGAASAANTKRAKRAPILGLLEGGDNGGFLGSLLGGQGGGPLVLGGNQGILGGLTGQGSLLGLGTNSGGLLGIGDNLAVLLKALGSGTEALTDNLGGGLKGVGLGNLGHRQRRQRPHHWRQLGPRGLRGLQRQRPPRRAPPRDLGHGPRHRQRHPDSPTASGDVYLQTGLGSALDEFLVQVGSAVDDLTVVLYKLLHARLLQLSAGASGNAAVGRK